ncbi:hypothetical protein BVC80_441g207 [Macleaya cordata]|uniref:Uncharacterized protein n=1 Tax=Macleaya cordata TaxID=56857 RepID=A0A200Q4M7_MACCD|nr:hypothetical protein BVC80_441g207 [Macleaya cordata]
METLVLVAQHRNHYYRRSKSHLPNRFGCSPSRGFRDFNCRTFQSGSGILPTPIKTCNSSSLNKKTFSSPTHQNSVSLYNKDEKHFKNNGKSSPSPINFKPFYKEKSFDGGFSDSKLWAGPAYSNSPPPSSLPIPKFTLQQKRSVSLEFPVLASEIKMQPIAKSAPPSPTREPFPSPSNFLLSTASATEDLRRILHLDIRDD